MIKKRSLIGQSVLEFALVLPLFFFMVTAIFDLGRAVLASSTLNNAVREGARYATVQKRNGDALTTNQNETTLCQTSVSDSTLVKNIKNKACAYVFGLTDIKNNTKIKAYYDADGTKVFVSLTYQFKPITPGMAAVLGKGKFLTIKAQSEMYLQAVAK